MSKRTTPELLLALAKDMRDGADPDEPQEQAFLALAPILEIAARQWDDRNYRGDHLLAAIGTFARAVEPFALDDPTDQIGETP